MKQRGLNRIAILIAFVLLGFSPLGEMPGFAVQVKEIIIRGNSIPLDFGPVLRQSGELSQKEIELLGTIITDLYHQSGYTTSYVDRFVLRSDGVLEIHVRESRIVGVQVSGVSQPREDEIASMIVVQRGEIYNRYILRDRVENVKRRFALRSIDVQVKNYGDSGDVYLSVTVRRSLPGKFAGGVTVEPIYGLTPEMGYWYPFNNSVIRIIARAGYRDDEFRKVEGDIRYQRAFGEGRWAFFLGMIGNRLIEQWESLEREYTTTSLTPVSGIVFMPGRAFRCTLSFREIITRLSDYRKDEIEDEFEDEFLDYDSRGTLELQYSDRYYLLQKREATNLKISVSGGRSTLENGGYVQANGSFRSSVTLLSWARFIPRLNVFYTTSDERFLWTYVFDWSLLGFFNDFTASKWKNTGGLDLELEISPEFLYIGPFVNSGYFKDEFDEWVWKHGGGAKTTVHFRGFDVQISYAWDLSRRPADGGLYIFVSGRF
jgi:hypothetical protein